MATLWGRAAAGVWAWSAAMAALFDVWAACKLLTQAEVAAAAGAAMAKGAMPITATAAVVAVAAAMVRRE
ncbi:hypothetical protein ACFV2H_17980 [Streptomyces sp. NPDC059629]|uniref:hypothetical protein n=1 Tax=Streptomyces sp. NPDC059629 TaxID=3346889 RepID=UPI00367AAAD9